MTFIRNNILLLVVFLTGAAVLILEVVATRILSPYFGNTIYTVSSVIGVFLAALSFGYYAGGTLADKKPFPRWFYGFIAVSGVSTILLQIIVYLALPKLGGMFSIIEGPPIISVLLFFLPAFLLGTLSPYAIKLQEARRPDQGIGTLAGQIFFVSTFGSIFGSMSAGFFLIPRFGVDQIVLSVGLGLVLLGVAGLVLGAGARTLGFSLLLAGIVAAGASGYAAQVSQADLLHVEDGIYEKIQIYEREERGRKARFLQQDHSESGAIFVDSEEHVHEYSKYYALYRILKPDLKDVLAVGGGSYTIPRAYLEELPDVRVDVVEIEPVLYPLAQKYFRLKPDHRITNHIQDGRRYLIETEKQYDLMFVDVYLYSVPVHFASEEFFKLARSRLKPGGIFLANFIGSLSRHAPSLLLSEMNTFRSVFPNSYFFAADSRRSINIQNIMILGVNGEGEIDFDAPEFKNSDYPLFRELSSRLVSPERFNFEEHMKFSDNYSPVEYLTARIFLDSVVAPGASQNGVRAPAGKAAVDNIRQYLSYGPGKEGRDRLRSFLEAELRSLAPEFTGKEFEWSGEKRRNLIARFQPEKQKRLIVASTYGTTMMNPGASRDASGAANLLEIARYLGLSPEMPEIGVDIVLLDAGDSSSEIEASVAALQDLFPDVKPPVILIRDVCDSSLEIRQSKLSREGATELLNNLWQSSRRSAPGSFVSATDDSEDLLASALVKNHRVVSLRDHTKSYEKPSDDTLEHCHRTGIQRAGSAILTHIYEMRSDV